MTPFHFFTSPTASACFTVSTCIGPDGPGVESWWRRDLPHHSRPVLRPTQLSIQRVPCLFPGGKVAGKWPWPPAPTSSEVKERVYQYSPSGPPWPLLGWTFFTFYRRLLNSSSAIAICRWLLPSNIEGLVKGKGKAVP